MATPCSECPFRISSAFSYDEDAFLAFEDGQNAPSCHKKVGLNAIFLNAPLDPEPGTECHGYEAWLQKQPGFQTPTLTTKAFA